MTQPRRGEHCGCWAAVNHRTNGDRPGILTLNIMGLGDTPAKAGSDTFRECNFGHAGIIFRPMRIGQVYRRDPRERPFLNERLGKPLRHGVNDGTHGSGK